MDPLAALRIILEQTGKLKPKGDGVDVLAEALRADIGRHNRGRCLLRNRLSGPDSFDDVHVPPCGKEGWVPRCHERIRRELPNRRRRTFLCDRSLLARSSNTRAVPLTSSPAFCMLRSC